MSSIYTHYTPHGAILPRAEFRVFGHGIIDTVKHALKDRVAVSYTVRTMPPEIYLISAKDTTANVKVREGLLDIKIKIGETCEGYEIFQPQAKLPFPVSATDLDTAFSCLNVHIPLPKAVYSVDDCVAIACTHPSMNTVTVKKTRHGFILDNILCEYAYVWFDSALWESACCESENYAGIHKVAQILGIAHMPNTNYVHAARCAVGMCGGHDVTVAD